MARRGKKPEEYGQLSLFEEHEPEWLKPVDQLGYTVANPDNGPCDAGFDSIFGSQEHHPDQGAVPDEDADDLVQFAAWLARNRS